MVLLLVSEPEHMVFSNSKFNEAEKVFLDREISALENRGVIQRTAAVPHCVSPLNAVPKPSGKFRLICDLRYVNILDLRDGFYHFSIMPEFTTYLGF